MIMTLYNHDKPIGTIAKNSTQYDTLLTIARRFGQDKFKQFAIQGHGKAEDLVKEINYILENYTMSRSNTDILLNLRNLLTRASGLAVVVME